MPDAASQQFWGGAAVTDGRRPLSVERRGGIITATIDDPETRNAMSDALLVALGDVFDTVAGDRTLKALVIQGAGGHFCAGAQLKSDALAAGHDAIAALSKRGAEVYRRLAALPLAVVAVVDGPAFGGGFGLACCADIVLCGPRARFALSETTLGLVPAQIAPFVVSRIGLPAARRLALGGTVIGAEEALAIGLADAAAADEAELAEQSAKVLAGIDRCGPYANAATKALLLSLQTIPKGFVDRAAEVFAAAVCGEEGREGVQAFREKRNPRWVEGL